MAQTRFIKFKDPLNSLASNERYVGIIPAALYCGFDTMTNKVGLSFQLDHETTGEVFTKQDLSQTPRRGAWITNQGVVIKEDAAIPLELETNAGNGSIRYDYLIGRHQHDIIYPGGIAASYEIVKGPLNNPSFPNVPNPETATILGYWILPANAGVAANVSWVRRRVPSLGGELHASIDKLNRYLNQQQFIQGADVIISVNGDFSPDGKNILGSIDDGNSFVVSGQNTLDLIPNKPNGTEIDLFFQVQTQIYNFDYQLDGGKVGAGVIFGYSAGYRPIVFTFEELKILTIKAGQVVKLKKVNSGGIFSEATPIYGDYWQVISVGDSNYRIQKLEDALAESLETIGSLGVLIGKIGPQAYDIKEIYVDPTLYFGSNGLGLPGSPWETWAICDGRNGTPNLSGRVTVGYDPADASYDLVGKTGGERVHYLTISEIPSHTHTLRRINTTGAGTMIEANYLRSGDNRGLYLQASADQSSPTGGGAGHENRQPFMAMLKIMKLPA